MVALVDTLAHPERAVANIDQAKTESLLKLSKIEAEAWQAWQRSQQPEQTDTVEGPEAGVTKVKRTTRGQAGNAKFLAEIRACVEMRAKILGLFAPVKVAPTSPDGEESYHDHVLRQLSDEELKTLEVVSEKITTAAAG